LDKLAGEKVVSAFASKNFNADLPEFAKLVPTTENLARLITERLQSFWPECIGDRVRLVRVHVQETDRNGFEILIGAPDSNECAKEKDENVVNA
jgi:6-pyruvoyl-tetrahydropterin synthase